MLAQTRLKLKNAETSIAFLQEQHGKTLEGLHSEIQKLQKQNASEYRYFNNILARWFINIMVVPFPRAHLRPGHGSFSRLS